MSGGLKPPVSDDRGMKQLPVRAPGRRRKIPDDPSPSSPMRLTPGYSSRHLSQSQRPPTPNPSPPIPLYIPYTFSTTSILLQKKAARCGIRRYRWGGGDPRGGCSEGGQVGSMTTGDGYHKPRLAEFKPGTITAPGHCRQSVILCCASSCRLQCGAPGKRCIVSMRLYWPPHAADAFRELLMLNATGAVSAIQSAWADVEAAVACQCHGIN